jgi:hypothetical protein
MLPPCGHEHGPDADVPTRIDTWSITSVQQGLVKTRGRLVKHAAVTTGAGKRAT